MGERVTGRNVVGQTLILIKHSMPEIDPSVPAKEWHLGEDGRARCAALAEHLTRYHPDVIVTSTEPKAVETAVEVAHHLGLSYTTAEGLHEHERPTVGYMSTETWEQSVATFFARPDVLSLGAETAYQALERFETAIGKVVAAAPGKTVAVVTHGTVMTLFVAHHTGVDPMSFWRKLGLPSFVVFSVPEWGLAEVVEHVV